MLALIMLNASPYRLNYAGIMGAGQEQNDVNKAKAFYLHFNNNKSYAAKVGHLMGRHYSRTL